MSSEILIAPGNKPRFTLFIPWTRRQYVDRMLDNINSLYMPRKDMEVVFYIDTDDKELFSRLKNWALLNQFVYNGMKIVVSGNDQPPDYDPAIAGTISNSIPRRQRIVRMKEDSKQYISATEFVFGLEDDSKIPHQAFVHLFEHFTKVDKLGFAMGVQQGRWNLPVLGAWKMDDLENPTVMQTMPFAFDPTKGDTVEIDGGGYFCYLTPVKLYKEHKYHWHDECFGPDATYGIELRKKGYKCLMDFRVICDHMTPQGILMPTPMNTLQVKWIKEGTRWVQQEPTSLATQSGTSVS